MNRLTGPYKGRYFILASASLRKTLVGSPYVFAKAEIFDGEPDETASNGVAKVGPEMVSDDLLDMLQSAENAARKFLDELP